jgi:D-beta-D-heptose 7-phosphate kinase/D-beta-D-heptose 1-phosphate adenosyltransferase
MGNRRLVSSIEKYSGTTVMCVGDVMLDHFVYGDVVRISPEAPIPVLSVDHDQSMLGGAGNVVRNLTSLGAKIVFVTVTGDDEAAGVVERLLASLPDCEPHVIRDGRRPTTIKTRYLSHGQQLLRVDAENASPLAAEVFEEVIARVRRYLSGVDVVLLSDYAKGVLSGAYAQCLITAARDAGKPVHVDPKGRDFRRYRGAALIKPNLKELSEATGLPISVDADIERAARRLIDHCGTPAVLVTRGASGMMLIRENQPTASFRSRAREVYDVSGAGDTVAATLAISAAAGFSMEDSVEAACVAAGLVVGKVGTATLTQSELMRELESTEVFSSEEKIMGVNEARWRIQLWRKMGLSVGFASGFFGLATAANVRLLSQAKQRCDRLIFGLCVDAPNENNAKNASDPDERSSVLASLASVDLVILCEGAGTAGLIGELRPDVVLDSID